MYYVYIYKDPRPTKNQQVVYVGKGTGDRDLSHWSRGSHNKPLQDFLSHLRQRGLEPIRQRVLETEDEQEAFKKEIELIALYGRRNIGTGTLFNLTDGGEGVSGVIKTAAHKENDKNNSLKNSVCCSAFKSQYSGVSFITRERIDSKQPMYLDLKCLIELVTLAGLLHDPVIKYTWQVL